MKVFTEGGSLLPFLFTGKNDARSSDYYNRAIKVAVKATGSTRKKGELRGGAQAGQWWSISSLRSPVIR